MLTCEELGIPHRLRRNGEKVIPHFENEELLFRWFKPNVQTIEGKITTASIGDVFRPPHETSVNRSSLCNHPTDVLYNHKGLPHRFNYGVIQAKVNSVEGYEFSATDNIGNDKFQVEIKFGAENAPEECMYPHSNITVYKNDKLIEEEIKSRILKADIRDELRLLFTVCHNPNPNFRP
jgi:hypothetical protein